MMAKDAITPGTPSVSKASLPKADPAKLKPKVVPSVKYRVSLAARTPLEHPTLEVVADSEDEARTMFNNANKISGSVHQYTVVPVA